MSSKHTVKILKIDKDFHINAQIRYIDIDLEDVPSHVHHLYGKLPPSVQSGQDPEDDEETVAILLVGNEYEWSRTLTLFPERRDVLAEIITERRLLGHLLEDIKQQSLQPYQLAFLELNRDHGNRAWKNALRDIVKIVVAEHTRRKAFS
jgi:hypothetical protein